uniref:Uncharacterized protein LOC100175309 n=1 Tax=Phallusia mammillata TaxID=59560 RepID=A0A6F9DGW5_9ASCI|nr:uncharacterized protein LOC100175309 [Phallusia mammillata]
MAMEKQFMISDTHTRTITAIGFHPMRREIVVGFEDGLMKWWEQDTGKLMLTSNEHGGWLTDFRYWSEQKILLSCANDGLIIAWGSGGNVVDRIRIGYPIYTMCLNLRRQQIICGLNGSVQLFMLDPLKNSGNIIDRRKPYVSSQHNDIVPCVICHESRVYTAGFDGKFCIYDTTLYPGTKGLDLIYCNKRAHDAGINCMILVKDNENNTWLITGSFDRTVKIWSQDGKLRHRLETIFLDTITSLCYIPRAKVVWIASGSQYATLFDPKAGENVSEFLPTFQSESDDEISHKLLKLRYSPDSGQIVGTTNRRHLIVWKFNTAGCLTALKCKHAIESVSYTRKVPMLLFSGGSNGTVYKWERLQSSHFMYSMEPLTRKECKDKLESIKKERGINAKMPQVPSSTRQVAATHYAFNTSLVAPSSLYKSSNISLLRCIYVEHLDLLVLASEDGNIYLWGFDYAAVSALTRLTPDKEENTETNDKFNVLLEANRTAVTPQTPDAGAARDVDDAVIDQLNNNLTMDDNQNDEKQNKNTSDKTGGPATPPADSMTRDSVTNRVAGFICKNVFIGHASCVTALAVVHNPDLYSCTYLISGGWDRRILIWCLETGKLEDCFRNTAPHDTDVTCDVEGGEDVNREEERLEEELACDGVIIDMEYCPTRNEFAYSSSDGMVYIREFSPKGSEMRMRNTLQGHELEITAVRWNPVYDKWITGSEDGTIKIWTADGMSCEHTLTTQGAVSSLCIDKVNGSIVAAVENVIKVYDMETCNLMQTNIGHTENIRSIVHVVERSQYVSGSWDKTIRIWNAYRRPMRRRRANMNEEENKPSAMR